jgi:iron complex outermembrane receptor protein
VYLDLGLDATDNIFLGGAVRFEDFSDFGENVTFKVNGRVKTSDNRFSLRGSVSSGFRAPSLHQIFLSNIQTLISAGTVSNQGTFDNDSPVLRQLGVDKLKEETATNITFGIASRPIDGLFVSVDVFQIDLDDRIVYSSAIASDDSTTTVGRILLANSITSLKFFINAVNTRTQGIDVVASYDWGKLRLNFAASFLDHSIEDTINTPDVLAADGIDIFDRKEQSRILTSRPTEKVILGASYDFDPITIGGSGIYFGSVTWQHAGGAAFDQTFSSKILVDLFASVRITNQISFTVSTNNLFDVFPDVIDTKGDVVTDLGGRFKYPWEVNQFGFNGRVILATVNFTL